MDLETCRIRVDVEIFESGKKKLRIQKYPDTCGRGLSQGCPWGLTVEPICMQNVGTVPLLA